MSSQSGDSGCNRNRLWREANRDKVRASRVRWKAANPDKVRAYNARYASKWNAANRCKLREYSARWRANHPDKARAHAARTGVRWRAENPAKMKACVDRWRSSNPTYARTRYRTDINFRLRCLLQSRLLMALRGHNKSTATMKLLGCTTEQLHIHLETRFKPGMTWKNMGRWHIDHKKPCASFDLTDPAQQRECFNYTNLQPLWAEENLKKGARVA